MSVTRVLLAAGASAALLTAQPLAQPADEVHVQRIRNNVFMLVVGGANVTVQVEAIVSAEDHDSIYGGDRGVLVVDSGSAPLGAPLLAAIRALSKGPLRYVINTSADGDHAGGNAALAKAGAVVQGAQGGGSATTGRTPLMLLAHENVLKRMSARTGEQAPTPLDAWPTDTFLKDKELFFNGESIQILHQPAAHSDGDSLVYLRRSDVISAGEIFSTVTFPKIDASRGGHVQGVIDGVLRILDLAIPGEKEEAGTMIVPGHGRLCDEADVEFYREMVTIVHDRVQAMAAKGMLLAQVEAARPALEYERRYSTPEWTAAMFVEAVYNDVRRAGLSGPPAK
jgi:glyoxylase-like metal-dependent hydrolase (beta-lactamase superfamily II)